ncbi:hypothetical protein TWF718_002761 [Orbilia javanica]|uniref:Uncharacterized protein n=1 Tax=Orbilia javanica TaxID=47235 RepID=A0AAN8MNU2_9PEZI
MVVLLAYLDLRQEIREIPGERKGSRAMPNLQPGAINTRNAMLQYNNTPNATDVLEFFQMRTHDRLLIHLIPMASANYRRVDSLGLRENQVRMYGYAGRA